MERRPLIVFTIVAAIAASAVAVVGLGEGSVRAQPIAGATYTGTADGGTVSLTVSADGTSVTSFTLAAPGVAFSSSMSMPIVNDAFEHTQEMGTVAISLSGSFSTLGSATGTLTQEFGPPIDTSTTVDWSATTAATPVPSPTPTATQPVSIPAHSWANFAWTGESMSAEEVANCYNDENIAVMYRLDAETQVFERWIRGREELSTMGDVAQFDVLLALNASDEAASCDMADPSPVAPRALTIPAHGWANFAWTGESISAEEVANCYNDESVAVMYHLDAETQVFERWIRGREELSTMDDVAQFDVLLALNASDEAATCQMPNSTEVPATPTPSPTPIAAGGSPTDYLDTFHATFDMSMEMDGLEMDFAVEGDFEASSRCSCDITSTISGMTLIEQHVIVTGRKAWISEDGGWYETTPSDPDVVAAAELCPACPVFWEDFVFEAPPLLGEHETKNGVAAIHYSLGELYETFAGIGLIPGEMEGISIDTFDVWVAEENKWLVCLDMEMCVEAEAMEELIGMPLDEMDSACMEMGVDVSQVNDPRIRVEAPR
jgi:hypothetical protein